MAKGYKSLHPVTEKLFRELGIPDGAITQGWGYAKASAGFHDPVGDFQGRQWSDCVDLAWDAVGKPLRDKLVAAGFAVFPRDWPGNQHVHCVQVGLTNDAGECRILPGPRQQIVDFTRGRSGLAGHGPWEGEWKPTTREQGRILHQYAQWVPDVVTMVLRPGGGKCPCYAWLAGDTVECEVRPLVEALGWRILDATGDGLLVRSPKGVRKELLLPNRYVAGEFLRAPVREIATGLKLKTAFEWAPEHTSCKVVLS